MNAIEMRQVSVENSAGAPILDRIDLVVGRGESVALVGRSGAGKTTALRLINGLVRPARGEVVVGGSNLEESDLVRLRRGIGYVIQGVGLFPHRSVYDNVATVPRLLRWDEERTRAAARRLLDELELPFDAYAGRFPRSLSGGEQQRVGIARALAGDPPILLCDEPFGALDPIVRRQLQKAFVHLRDVSQRTIVFVTHDLAEALFVAKRVVLFDGGRVVADLPAEEFVRSEESRVREFVEASRSPVEIS
ncbi:MAG: ATP-binding cassette domain-containing protein [Thermoanaerobaculia bacterium]